MKVLVTGGAGYVGSHVVRALCESSHEVMVLDNLCAGHIQAVDSRAVLVRGEVGDSALTGSLMVREKFDAVLHFAAFAEVGESVRDPLRYYQNNVCNTVALLQQMQRHGVRRMVFSSSCAVYGTPDRVPVLESWPPAPESPYGRTKLAVEWALADSSPAWGLGFAALRYFNAAGASADARIGEDHRPETHLIPSVLKVALGQKEVVSVFGDDYDTFDGTCMRDYVHVEDLALAHIQALEALRPGERHYYNIGTGHGATVLDVINAARVVTGHPIPIKVCPRRAGDPSRLFADAGAIQRSLGWKPRYTSLVDIVAGAWGWHRTHPHGFERCSDPSEDRAVPNTIVSRSVPPCPKETAAVGSDQPGRLFAS